MKKIDTCKNCTNSEIIKVYYEYDNKKGRRIGIVVKRCKKCGAYLIPKGLFDAHPGAFTLISDEITTTNIEGRYKEGDIVNIEVRDFMIRKNVFKCMNENHNLEHIKAIIRIINRRGEIIEEKVPAGYCQSCDMFFIMESTFETLKRWGVVLCKITDENTYKKSSLLENGMILSDESILKQYGYNVSQTSELSEIQRQKLLSQIIDYKVMTQSEIISYLNFFINQRKANPKYEIAISKWVKDREYISSYSVENARAVKVRSINTVSMIGLSLKNRTE